MDELAIVLGRRVEERCPTNLQAFDLACLPRAGMGRRLSRHWRLDTLAQKHNEIVGRQSVQKTCNPLDLPNLGGPAWGTNTKF